MAAQNDVCIPVFEDKTEQHGQEDTFDYSQRGQWLRAAVLGATDGLVSVASLMMGVGAVKHDARAMILTGFAGLIAGACSMAIDMFGQQTDKISVSEDKTDDFDYSQRGQWLRAAVLGATDGLVSVASLMMGVGAVKHDVRAMILTGFAGLVAGACSMAIGEFVSVYSQRDVEVAQMKRDNNNNNNNNNNNRTAGTDGELDDKEALPNPFQAAAASALAFMLGAFMPLVAAAFIMDHKVRLCVVVATVSLALVVFGWIGAVLGRTPVVKSCLRILLGGWMAMAVTFGLTMWVGSIEL